MRADRKGTAMRRHTIGSMALVIALLVFPSRAAPADCTALDKKIAAAKTAADHEAIAACFDDKAKAAQAGVDEHTKMAEAYRQFGGAPVEKLGLPTYCDAFVRTLDAVAKTYEKMAAAHRELAKSVK